MQPVPVLQNEGGSFLVHFFLLSLSTFNTHKYIHNTFTSSIPIQLVTPKNTTMGFMSELVHFSQLNLIFNSYVGSRSKRICMLDDLYARLSYGVGERTA